MLLVFQRRRDRRHRAIGKLAAGLREIDSRQLTERVLALRVNARRGVAAAALLPECLALTAEAARRVTGESPSDADLVAGATLCAGVAMDDRHLADPALVLALPTVLHAVHAGGAHLLAPTQHDAARRAAWLRPVAELLGLRVSLLEPHEDKATRGRHHQAEIVCGQVSEFAFDVLRDWLTEDAADRVGAPRRAAVIDQIDVVLLDRGDLESMISAPVKVDHDWHRWAEDAASRLWRAEHAELSGYAALLSPAGFATVLELLELADVYRDHVPVFDLVSSALVAQRGFRRGLDYEVVGGEVVAASEVPDRVTAALTVHEGLPLTTAKVTLAATTERCQVRRYPFVAGIGVIDPTAARQLRELGGLSTRTGDPDGAGADDVACVDDEIRMRGVRAATRAAHDSGRAVVLAAATAAQRATIPADLSRNDQVVVVGPDDPIPDGWRHAVLIGIGRSRTRRRDIRLARTTESARFYLTTAELTSMAGDQAEQLLSKVLPATARPVSNAEVTALVAQRQNDTELSHFFRHERRRLTADLREAQLDELTARCAALSGEQAIGTFRRLTHNHLDALIREHRGRYPDLRDAIARLYPCELPPWPPTSLATAAHADADRAFTARAREIEEQAGVGAMARMIYLVTRNVRDRRWRGHLADLHTLSTVCAYTVAQGHLAAQLTARAEERFSTLWRAVVEEIIAYVHQLELGPASR